jgi:hypothetical protein
MLYFILLSLAARDCPVGYAEAINEAMNQDIEIRLSRKTLQKPGENCTEL